MGKINTCLWAESSPCFLRCLWFSELFVCCLQTTSGVCLCCERRLLLKQSQHMIRLERLYFTGESQVTKRSDSCLSLCASRVQNSAYKILFDRFPPFCPGVYNLIVAVGICWQYCLIEQHLCMFKASQSCTVKPCLKTKLTTKFFIRLFKRPYFSTKQII